ncbi:unnamed protein product [Camellia sinensis]
MFGSIEKDNSESCRVGKRKVGETDNDEDYQPLDDEGLSSSSDNGEPFDSQVIEDIHMGPASIPVLGKKRVRGPTRGKNVEKIRKERGDRIPVTLNRLTRAIEGDYATPLAAALGQQIRVHAPQTFDFGDYNNDVDVRCIIDHKCQTLYSEWKSRLHTHYKSLKKDNVSDLKSQILYPCTKDDWEWMIDNLWETDDWKVKSENAMKARGCVKV